MVEIVFKGFGSGSKKVWNRTHRRRYSYKLRAYFYLYFDFWNPNPKGSLLRSGAKVGDGIFVSGTIGDAALGLMLRGNRSLSCSSKGILIVYLATGYRGHG